jgi:hypothetical protein
MPAVARRPARSPNPLGERRRADGRGLGGSGYGQRFDYMLGGEWYAGELAAGSEAAERGAAGLHMLPVLAASIVSVAWAAAMRRTGG